MSAARHLTKLPPWFHGGGRPDPAWQFLAQMKAPTLLLVGEMDHTVIELNRRAVARLQSEKRFKVVSGAGKLRRRD
jgi:putative phosphoribosyl transferase